MQKRNAEWMDHPEKGKWPAGDKLPLMVKIRGAQFVRTMGLPKHEAVAQYREDTATNSRHLYVTPGGKYIIDHRDEHNPHSSPISHFIKDVMPKAAQIEPNVFSSFAREVIERIGREERGEIEDNSPLRPYRDSQIEKAVKRVGDRDAPKTSGLMAPVLFNRHLKSQAKRKAKQDPEEDIIPGSGYLAHGGIPYEKK